MIHTQRGTAGLEAPNQESDIRIQRLVVMPRHIREGEKLGDGFQLFFVLSVSHFHIKLITSRRIDTNSSVVQVRQQSYPLKVNKLSS